MKKLWNWLRDKRTQQQFICRIEFGPVHMGIVVSGKLSRREARCLKRSARGIGKLLDGICMLDSDSGGGPKAMMDIIMGLFAALFGPLATSAEEIDMFLSKTREAMLRAAESVKDRQAKKEEIGDFLDSMEKRGKPTHTVH